MLSDPYQNPDAKWRKAAKSHRRKRGFPWVVVVVLGALAVFGGGFVWWVSHPPTAEERFADFMPRLLEGWDSMDAETFFEQWCSGDFQMKARLRRIFGSKGWTNRRPALDHVRTEISPSGRSGRIDFHPRGLPPDALAKVYVKMEYGQWRVVRIVLVKVPDAGK